MNLKMLKFIKSVLVSRIKVMKLCNVISGRSYDNKEMNLAKETLKVINLMIKGEN